ncbi:MAG: TonB family protein, partial [Opitutae bacterium]|nr:TonB family protein [Opitutae bacterium]
PPQNPTPTIISYDQFVKRDGAPETPKTVPVQPKKAPKIDTSRIEQNLRKSIMSVPELSISTPSSAAQTDELLAWKRLLAARLDQEWKKTKSPGTVGRSVRVKFIITAAGAISNVRVVSSSGFADLDKNAILTVRRLGIFQPPPIRQEVPIGVWFKVE